MPPTCARHLLRDVRRGMVHPNEPMNAPLHIAPLTAADLAAACALDPTDTGCRGRLLWHLHTPYAQALKAEQGAQLLGHACGLVHGSSGWVRHLHTAAHTTEVAPALLAAVVDWMEAHGAHSQVAIAPPGAEAPYTACGFEETGSLLHYTHGHFLEATRAEVVDLAPEHGLAVLRLDQQATGEDRSTLLREHLYLGSVYAEGTQVRGFLLPLLGHGLIVADSPAVGLELQRWLLPLQPYLHLPVGHLPAHAHLIGRRYRPSIVGTRMVRGTPLAYRPHLIYAHP